MHGGRTEKAYIYLRWREGERGEETICIEAEGGRGVEATALMPRGERETVRINGGAALLF